MDQQLTTRSSSDHQYNPWVKGCTGGMIITILCLLFLSFKTIGQTDTYNQWSNEFQFARPFNDRWAGELWLGSTFSSTPNESSVFKTNIQRYATPTSRQPTMRGDVVMIVIEATKLETKIEYKIC